MPKSIAHWEDVLDKARKQKRRYTLVREALAPSALADQPSPWKRDGDRWVRKNPLDYHFEIIIYLRTRMKWARVNRSLARVEKSIAHAEERLASQKNVWDHLRLGAKQTASEARRCISSE